MADELVVWARKQHAVSLVILFVLTLIAITVAAASYNLIVSRRIQERPYVGFVSGQITLHQDRLVVIANVKNSGATPAFALTRWINCRSEVPGSTYEPKIGDTGVENVRLLPGSVHDLSEGLTSADYDCGGEVDAFVSGTRTFYVWGLVKYRDIFGYCQYAFFESRAGQLEGGARKLTAIRSDVSSINGQRCNSQGKADFP